MCLAFQTEEAVSVGDTPSGSSPIPLRCWLTRSTTCAAAPAWLAGQLADGTQSPTAALAGVAHPSAPARRRAVRGMPSTVAGGAQAASGSAAGPARLQPIAA